MRACATGSHDNQTGRPFDPAALKPFTDGEPYLGTYETGLYPGAQNELPTAYRRAGERLAATIRPLDAEGNLEDGRGEILALALGPSNTRMYFGALRRFLATPHREPREREQASPRAEYLAQFDAVWPCGRKHTNGWPAVASGRRDCTSASCCSTLRLAPSSCRSSWRSRAQCGNSPRQVQVLLLHTRALPSAWRPRSFRSQPSGRAIGRQRAPRCSPEARRAAGR